MAAAVVMMMMRETGIDIAPGARHGRHRGLAMGFGAQTLVKDVISGFFLLAEEQVRIGDVVRVREFNRRTKKRFDELGIAGA